MLSRVADSIFWMSRYIERAENVARFVDVNLRLILDVPVTEAQQWEPLIITSGDEEGFKERYGEFTQQNVVYFLTYDQENPNSILSCLSAARENARTVREVISSEMWEQINWFYMTVRSAMTTGPGADVPQDFFSKVKMASHLFCGITDNTFSHGEGWHFANMSRLFERADKTARILDVKYFMLLPHVDYVGTPFDTLLWTALLFSASAFEMYRKQHGHIVPETVAGFLLLDREFPRSVRYCLAEAEASLREITGTAPGTTRYLSERRLGQLRSEFEYAQISEVIRYGLHEYIDDFQLKLNQVGEAVYQDFLALRAVPTNIRSSGQVQSMG
ncbi:MAG: alpha-E domain-containing protein [Phycisphaeraceae bacterium]